MSSERRRMPRSVEHTVYHEDGQGVQMVDSGPVYRNAGAAAAAAVRLVSVSTRLGRAVGIVAVTYLVRRTFFDAVPLGEFAALPELIGHRGGQSHYSPV